MLAVERGPKRLILWVFLSFTFLYVALSPGSVQSQGYMAGNLSATASVVHNLKYWLTLRKGPTALSIPHNGVFEAFFELPLVLLSRLVFGPSWKWYDRLLSLESVLFTSLMCTLVFAWTRKITNSARWGLVLALTAGFTTMVWPYAYINMETTQSFFVLLAGYLAFGSERKKRWLAPLAFAVTCGLAVSTKPAGVFLLPAIGFLVYTYFRSEQSLRARWYKTALAAGLVAALWGVAAFTRPGQFNQGNSGTFLDQHGVPPIRYVLNVISFYGSINKGLFIYCPVLVVAVFCIARAYREDRSIVTFALLTLAGMTLGCSLFYWWADETWGPRYLHCAVAPLIVCLGLAREALTRRLSKFAFVALALVGLFVSSLGALFEYHNIHVVAIFSSPSDIEQLQYDVTWNPIWFDLRLMRLWLRGPDAPISDTDFWPPERHAWASLPENRIESVHPLNIRQFAVPQAYLIRSWRKWHEPGDLACWWASAISLALGAAGFAMVGYRIARMPRVADSAHCENDGYSW